LPEFLYFLLVQLSLFALGTLFVTIIVLSVRKPPFWGAYLTSKLGVLINTSIIIGLVIPSRIVRPGVLAYLYIVGTALIGGGMVFVCRDLIRRSFKGENEWHKPS
jgi:hypothetical protein